MPRAVSISMALGALILLAGCAPKLNPKLVPAQGEARMLKGNAWMDLTRAGVTVSLANVRSGLNDLEFAVEVANHGERSVLVSPELFEITRGAGPDGNTRTTGAVDPEEKIRQCIFMEEREKAAQQSHATAMLLFAVLDVADTAANSANRTQQENRQAQDTRRQTYQDGAETQERSRRTVGTYEQEREKWEMDYLRRTTVDPGQNLRGIVKFEVDVCAATNLILRVSVGGEIFEFDLKPKG